MKLQITPAEMLAVDLGDAAARLRAEAQLEPHVGAARAEALRLREHGASWWQRYKQRALVGRLTGTAKWLRDPSRARRVWVFRMGGAWGAVMFFGPRVISPLLNEESLPVILQGPLLERALITLPLALAYGLLNWAFTKAAYKSTLHELGITAPAP